MSETNQGATAAAPAAVPAADDSTINPGVVAPEIAPEEGIEKADETPEQKAQREYEKALRKMERRIGRLTARAATAEARLAEFQVTPRPSPVADASVPSEAQRPLTEQDVQQQAKALVQRQQLDQKCNAIFEAGTKASETFADDVKSLVEVTGPLFDHKGQPVALMAAILECDAPEKVLMHLSADQDLAEELTKLSPLQQTRRLTRLEDELAKAPKPSAAPRPIKPLGGGAASTVDPMKLSADEWARRRNEELAKRHRAPH